MLAIPLFAVCLSLITTDEPESRRPVLFPDACPYHHPPTIDFSIAFPHFFQTLHFYYTTKTIFFLGE
jgi:hypothetical protein